MRLQVGKPMPFLQWSHTTTKLFHQSSLPPAEPDMTWEIWQSQNSHSNRDIRCSDKLKIYSSELEKFYWSFWCEFGVCGRPGWRELHSLVSDIFFKRMTLWICDNVIVNDCQTHESVTILANTDMVCDVCFKLPIIGLFSRGKVL
jgi:hypothetical protein